ncbi:MAG: NADPH:quinone reductase-like Zn-dependent oxidoreductase [Kiritimatiellia bacterium]
MRTLSAQDMGSANANNPLNPGMSAAGGEMKAVILTQYGPPEGLQLQEVDKPIPKAGEVLVRVHNTTVTAGDCELRALALPWLFQGPIRLWLGLIKPKPKTILGMQLAGVVESVAKDVRAFEPGDEVFAASGMRFGAYAEYVCVPVDGLIAKVPNGVSLEQSVCLPVEGMAALGYLRKGGIETAKTVLVRGASGGIGTFAVQLAKHHGAHVTAVCGTEGVDRVRALGADVVIDYTQQEFSDNGVSYDLILDVVGKMPISRCARSLSMKGAYVRGTVPGLWEVLQALWFAMASRKRVVLGDAGESVEDLVFLGGLLQQGKLESVIDRRYPIEQAAEAHRYVERGHKQGHVVIEVAG